MLDINCISHLLLLFVKSEISFLLQNWQFWGAFLEVIFIDFYQNESMIAKVTIKSIDYVKKVIRPKHFVYAKKL